MRFLRKLRVKPRSRAQSIVIVGAGPAGLYAAGGLASEGYAVDVIDSLPEPGGLLACGIPDVRMTKDFVRDAARELEQAAVRFRLNTTVGSDVRLAELIERYEAVVIATGAWKSRKLGVPGEELSGVHHALDYLVGYALAEHGHRAKLAGLRGCRVLVVGGGLTAVDACLVAKEAGAREILWWYRRRREDAPGRHGEGGEFDRLADTVQFCELTQPVRFLGSQGRVEAVEAVRMKPGPPDSSGRPRPVPLEGSRFTETVDRVFLATGEVPTPPPGAEDCSIQLNERESSRVSDIKFSRQVAVPKASGQEAPGPAYVALRRDMLVWPRGSRVPAGSIRVDGAFRTTRRGVFAVGNVVDGPTQAGYAAVEGMLVAKRVASYLEDGRWDSDVAEYTPAWHELLVG